MIETVYSNENGELNRTNRVQSPFKMPKNIRQVGKSNAVKKIYVEDYVMTFIKQLAGEDYSRYQVAVLIGQYIKMENSRCLFISGAVEVDGIDLTNGITFTNDIWNSIYENIKKYFAEAEIMGWFLGGPGYLLEDKERILKAHIDNFAGQDKTLLTFDNMEKEESFFFYENSRLCKQEGYYIYYEKNNEMQAYMIDHNKSDNNEAGYDDRVSREMRTIIQNKKPVPDENKSVTRLMYAAGTLLAVIVLVVGAAMLNNYDQMKTMQKALDSLSHNLTEMEAGLTEDNADAVSEQPKEEQHTSIDTDGTGDSLEVKVVPGDVVPLEPEQTEQDELADDNKDTADSQTASSEEIPEEEDEEVSEDDDEELPVKYYTVVSGDSLAGISYKLYKSANYISVIKEMNNIEDENMIYIGQRLMIP